MVQHPTYIVGFEQSLDEFVKAFFEALWQIKLISSIMVLLISNSKEIIILMKIVQN